MQLIRSSRSRAEIEPVLDGAGWRMFHELPFGAHGRAYYRAVAGADLDDQTFAFRDEHGFAALVECNVAGGSLGNFGFAIEPRLRTGLAHDVQRQLVVDILAELRRVAVERGAATVRLRSAAQNDPYGLLLGHAAEEGARAEVELRAVADLAQGREALLADLRAGHRRHVRWGADNMRLVGVDASAPDHAAFESFRSLHAEVAGRVTRRAESWDEMYRAIVAGCGDLVLAYLEGRLVGGTLVLDGPRTAYYASGAYRRELFDKPLSHVTMFEAIVRSAGRGRAYFDVGDLPARDSGVSGKELDIGHFKRGFCSRTLTSILLTWKPQEK
jgi:GNAT acetyltransferase-like protein